MLIPKYRALNVNQRLLETVRWTLFCGGPCAGRYSAGDRALDAILRGTVRWTLFCGGPCAGRYSAGDRALNARSLETVRWKRIARIFHQYSISTP